MADVDVSVIVPTYRQPHLLVRAVRSVLEQDHRDLEVVVVDDCSRDGSLGAVLALQHRDARVRVLARRSNGGLGRARNAGVAASRGRYLAFLDGDDYLLPGSISARLGALRRLPARMEARCVGSYGDWLHVPEHVDDPPSVRAPRTGLGPLSLESYTGENLFVVSAPLVSRAAVVDAGGFPEDLPGLEDFVLWARVVAAGGVFVPVERVVAVYRQRPTSMLRGRGPELAAISDAINDYLLGQGADLVDESWEAWLGGQQSRAHRREGWLLASTFSTGPAHSRRAAGVADTLAADDSPALGDVQPWPDASAPFLHRSANDLGGALTDVDEVYGGTYGSVGAASTAARERRPVDVEVAVTASTPEQALEAVALVLGLRSVGTAAALVRPHAKSWPSSWPLALADLPMVSAEDVTGAETRWVVFSDESRTTLPRRVERASIVQRTSGLEAVEAYRRFATKALRSGHRLLGRSRLEAAEVGGNRNVALLASGVRVGADQLWGSATGERSGVVLLVPPVVVDSPVADAWVSTALSCLPEGQPVTIASGHDGRRRLQGFRVAPLDVRQLRGSAAVVAPLCEEVSLAECLGVPTVIFDPVGASARVTPLWLRGRLVARDARSLRSMTCAATNGGLPPPRDASERFARDMGALDVFDGDITAFGEAARRVLSEEL